MTGIRVGGTRGGGWQRRNPQDADPYGGIPLETWRILFDPEKTTIREFLQVWKIRTEAETARGEKTVKYVLFSLWPEQIEMLRRCEEAWDDGRSYRVRIPKSRRRGVSAFWRAFLGFERVLRVPGWEHTITAQSVEDSEEHLSYLSEFYDQVPPAVLRDLGIARLKGNSRQFVFRHGNFQRSKVTVKTARKSGLGRGGQNNSIHMTERPHYPPKAKVDLNTSLLPNCADVSGNVIVDESTAMGFDEFYQDCRRAVEGKGSYDIHFLPAMGRQLNYKRFPNKRARERFVETLDSDPRYGIGEEAANRERCRQFWITERGVSEREAEKKALEFLKWRRRTIDDETKYVGHHKREHPTTLDEAFQGSGRLVYPPEIVESWAPAARREWEGATPGVVRLSASEPTFYPQHDGLLTVRELPQKGSIYVIGADVASGHRTIASSYDEADFSTAVVGELTTGRVVAVYRGHVFPKPFADDLVLLSALYGGAKTFIEVNVPTVVAHILEMDEEVAGFDPPELLLTSERKVRTEAGQDSQIRFGWHTSQKTKRWMISQTERFMREWGRAEGEKGSPVDYLTAGELLRYVYDDRGGASAEEGHDDMVIAFGLMVLARDLVLSDATLQSEVNTAPSYGPVWEAFLKQRRGRGKRQVDPVLGRAF